MIMFVCGMVGLSPYVGNYGGNGRFANLGHSGAKTIPRFHHARTRGQVLLPQLSEAVEKCEEIVRRDKEKQFRPLHVWDAPSQVLMHSTAGFPQLVPLPCRCRSGAV